MSVYVHQRLVGILSLTEMGGMMEKSYTTTIYSILIKCYDHELVCVHDLKCVTGVYALRCDWQ